MTSLGAIKIVFSIQVESIRGNCPQPSGTPVPKGRRCKRIQATEWPIKLTFDSLAAVSILKGRANSTFAVWFSSCERLIGGFGPFFGPIMNQIKTQLTPSSIGLEGKQVLVVGNRRPIIETLKRIKVPFAVWTHRPTQRPIQCLKSLALDFPTDPAEIRAVAENEFASLGSFSDVIAGTESSVLVASVCRRALGTRKTKDTIARRCSDKQHMKELMREHSVPMVDFLFRSDAESADQVFDQLGPKVVIKQRRNSGGRGLTIASSAQEVAARKERGLLYERFVDSHEMSVESIVRDGKIVFTSTTNYIVKTHANIVPANIPDAILERALEINRIVISALKLSWGMTHAEFYWPADGSPDGVLFGEVALRPPGGYIMDCISLAFGFDAWEGFIANELNLSFVFPQSHDQTAGVAMLHAGEGTVQSVTGTELVKQMPSCCGLKMLTKPGAVVSKRVGVGEISGYGMFASNDSAAVSRDVLQCLETLKFQMSQT